MADHLRKRIRGAVITACTGLATTGSRVYAGRVDPLPDTQGATLLVDMGPEEIVASSLGGAGRLLERRLGLVLRAMVKTHAATYLDTLDQIAKEVEVALAADQTLGGLVKWVQPESMEEPELDGQGDKVVASLVMRFACFYYAALNAPDTPR